MDQDAEQGTQLRDFILERLQAQKGYNLDERIRDVQNQYRDAAGQELTDDEAKEEIAADALGDVIGTEENIRRLAKTEAQKDRTDQGLLQRLGGQDGEALPAASEPLGGNEPGGRGA